MEQQALIKKLQLTIGCLDLKTVVNLHNMMYIEQLALIDDKIIKEKDLTILKTVV